MRRNKRARLHYQSGVLGMIGRAVAWLRRYRYLSSPLEKVIVLVSAAAFLACDNNRLNPELTIVIICVALVVRGLWAAVMDGMKTCLRTMLDGIYVGLMIVSLVVLLGKSYPQQEIARFGVQLVYICMFFVFWSQVYGGMLVELAMTSEEQWQKGHHWRQKMVATIRRLLLHR
jgi:hypothetical protein